MSANRIHIQTLVSPKCFQFTLRGVVDPADLGRQVTQTYTTVDDPWQYDQIYDVRGLINVFARKDYSALSKLWTDVAANYRVLRVAVVTTDPFRMDRTRMMSPLFANLELHVFPALEGAFAWLESEPTASIAPVAGRGA